jgi:simple sugar transport system permease protein
MSAGPQTAVVATATRSPVHRRLRIAFERRPEPSRTAVFVSPLIAALATLLVGFALFTALGKDPLTAFHAFFLKPLDSAYGVSELLLKASPLMLIATGLAVGYRANVWNIGAEGQLLLGAIAGGGLALAFEGSESPLLLPAMLLAGALGGMAWAAIPALLRTRFNANEILVSLMLVYVATHLLSWLVHGPWRDPDGFNFPQSKQFHAAATIPMLFEGLRVNAGLFVSLAIVAIGYVFMQRSLAGFHMRVAGLAPAAATYAGISSSRTVWLGMLAGGACAGLAGVQEAAGPVGQLLPALSPGYGFAAIIVAFVGRLHAIGILLASLLMSLLYLGGESAQLNLALPSAVTGLFQGTLLFFLLAADVLIHYRVRLRRSETQGVA